MMNCRDGSPSCRPRLVTSPVSWSACPTGWDAWRQVWPKLEIRQRRPRVTAVTSRPAPPTGIHLLQPGLDGSARVAAFCDLENDGGNWTVFQRRADIEPREDFYRGWAAYKKGFGNLDKEFWWGLENLWAMTSSRERQYELRIDLEDFEGGKRHAIYQNFSVSAEPLGYRLRATGYTGDAGNSLRLHIGDRFSTKDKDQDVASNNCAQTYKGAWWYRNCHDSNLNGQYLSGHHRTAGIGVNWGRFGEAVNTL